MRALPGDMPHFPSRDLTRQTAISGRHQNYEWSLLAWAGDDPNRMQIAEQILGHEGEPVSHLHLTLESPAQLEQYRDLPLSNDLSSITLKFGCSGAEDARKWVMDIMAEVLKVRTSEKSLSIFLDFDDGLQEDESETLLNDVIFFALKSGQRRANSAASALKLVISRPPD